MEKNPNSSTKVPPRSTSTGPTPGESKPKTGEDLILNTWLHARGAVSVRDIALHYGLLGPSWAAQLVYQ